MGGEGRMIWENSTERYIYITICKQLKQCCQPLDQFLLSCAINAYLAEKQPLHCRVIIVCRPLDQRLSDAWSAPNHPPISAYWAAQSAPVSCLTSTYKPLDQHLIRFTMSIYWAMQSSPQPHDLCLISRAICAWEPNAKYSQPLDRRSSAARSASANDFISTFQPLDQRLSASWSAIIRR